MSRPRIEHVKNVCELTIPENGEPFLHIVIEYPAFSPEESGISKINMFYEKKLQRAEKYYKKAVKEAMERTERAKRRGRTVHYPSEIVLSFLVTQSDGGVVSVLRKGAVTDINGTTESYCSDNWDAVTGCLFDLRDVLYAAGITRRTALRYIADAYGKTGDGHTKHELRKIMRSFTPENMFYKDGVPYYFFQPEGSGRGLISLPLDIEAMKAYGESKTKRRKTGADSGK